MDIVSAQAWRHLGLRILPHGAVRPLSIAIGTGLMFGAYMAVSDAVLFRSVIPVSQETLISSFSAIDRIAYFTPLAVIDELEFRLVVMSALAWLLTAAGLRRPWCFWAAILVTALVIYPALHLAYLSALEPTPLTVAREIMLHGFAGILWGYLYWRYGLIAAMIGHISAHVSLQPMLGLFFN
jgi:hypothetical protein